MYISTAFGPGTTSDPISTQENRVASRLVIPAAEVIILLILIAFIWLIGGLLEFQTVKETFSL